MKNTDDMFTMLSFGYLEVMEYGRLIYLLYLPHSTAPEHESISLL